MRILAGMVSLALMTACGGRTLSPQEQAAEDARLIAAVESANQLKPAIVGLDLQPIGYPDMEANQLFGTSCAFVPEGGGLSPVFLAMQEGGHLKLDGKIISLVPDNGSPEMPYGSRETYTGTNMSARLTVEGGWSPTAAEAVTYPARLVISDEFDRPVYDQTGQAQCSG